MSFTILTGYSISTSLRVAFGVSTKACVFATILMHLALGHGKLSPATRRTVSTSLIFIWLLTLSFNLAFVRQVDSYQYPSEPPIYW